MSGPRRCFPHQGSDHCFPLTVMSHCDSLTALTNTNTHMLRVCRQTDVGRLDPAVCSSPLTSKEGGKQQPVRTQTCLKQAHTSAYTVQMTHHIFLLKAGIRVFLLSPTRAVCPGNILVRLCIPSKAEPDNQLLSSVCFVYDEPNNQNRVSW